VLRQAVESGIVTLYRETLIGRYLERELTREEAVDELGVAAVDELDVAAVDELDVAAVDELDVAAVDELDAAREAIEADVDWRGGRSECD
jgi:uncharacterized protein YlxP (DUF503 family)